jgi:hypothetical protein
MENTECKKGDWVVRLNEPHLGINVGQVCQVYEIDLSSKNQPRLIGQDTKMGSHAYRNLRKAEPHEIPGYQVPQLFPIY